MLKKTFFPLVVLVVFTTNSCKQRDYKGDLITETSCSSDKVYYQNTIQPILVSHCALPNCHNSTTEAGGVNLTNYNSVMKIVVFDEPENSHLYLAVGSNYMPQSPYPPLSNQEKQLIYTWIDQGAYNNYCSDCDTTQYEFAADIWPIIELNCSGCHGSTNPAAGITLLNYNDVKQQVDNSTIPGVLNGVSYPLMPPTNGLLPCEKEKIINWVNLGAPEN